MIATTNINPEKLKNYTSNDQFNVNVKPILDAFDNDNSLKAVSIVLAKHPLKLWIDEAIKFDWPKDEPTSTLSNTTIKDKKVSPEKWLAEKLTITPIDAKKPIAVEKALSTKNQTERKKLWDEMSTKFSRNSAAKSALQTALNNKITGQL